MALITVLDVEGRPMLVHTSAFDPPHLRTASEWAPVWARADGPDEPDDEAPPPPSDSTSSLRDTIESDEQRDIDEGEGKDRFGIA